MGSTLPVYGTIGGGAQNAIETNVTYATIGGGIQNRIQTNGSYATIGGGDLNVASGIVSVIGGGSANQATSNDCVVAGGWQNAATGLRSAVGGGNLNSANAPYTVVAGGQQNLAQGDYATVPGGSLNAASGRYSFAAGRQAKAVHDGAFVWADGQAADFYSTAYNQVLFRCLGGVYFTSGSPSSRQTVSWVPGDADWLVSSDRNLKDRIEPVDPVQVLDKLVPLPLSEWSYRGYPQRHIGPMAQDFHALFPLNDSDTTIDGGDLHGVALAAIQGLNRKLEEREASLRRELESVRGELARGDAENASLKQTVNELKELMKVMADKLNGGEQ